MFRLPETLVLIAVGLLLATAAAALGAATDAGQPPEAVVVSPKSQAVVSEVDEVEGRLAGPGWPVLLVRATSADSPWWVQPPVSEVVDGKFTARVHVGDATTPART